MPPLLSDLCSQARCTSDAKCSFMYIQDACRMTLLMSGIKLSAPPRQIFSREEAPCILHHL